MPPPTLSDPPSDPQSLPRIPPKRPRIDPKARLTFGFRTPEAPVVRFSDPRGTLSLDFCRLYRYCIDTVSIQYRYSLHKSKDRVLLGSENRRSGELWGRSWVASGGSWGDSGGSEGGQRGSGEAAGGRNFFLHFRRFKIMKLCQNLNLVLKRLEID